MRKLLAALALAFALSARATPVTVTINVPVLSWVTPSESIIGAFAGDSRFLDAYGVVWTVNPLLVAPVAGGPTGYLVFAAADCSGTPFVQLLVSGNGFASGTPSREAMAPST
jgi:hypothetical protein